MNKVEDYNYVMNSCCTDKARRIVNLVANILVENTQGYRYATLDEATNEVMLWTHRPRLETVTLADCKQHKTFDWSGRGTWHDLPFVIKIDKPIMLARRSTSRVELIRLEENQDAK